MAKEYIEREAALELLKDDDRCGYLDSGDILSIPAADVVEVVRCRDCTWWNDCDDESYCSNPDGLDNYAMPDDFCSYGERRGNDGT